MSPATAYALLFLAAAFEAGGDALIRAGLVADALPTRAALLLAGGAVLFAYGLLVNAPPWDFGRLLGVYVTLFFLVAQALNLVVFGVRPAPPVLAGGSLVILGGLVMAFWRP